MDDENRERVQWPTVPLREAHWIIRLFSSSRYFAAFAVLGTFLAAITLYVYGTLVVIQLIWHTREEYRISVEGVKHLQPPRRSRVLGQRVRRVCTAVGFQGRSDQQI